MSDPYIDQFEAIGYGRFSVAQILGEIVGLERAYDNALEHAASTLGAATDALEQAVSKAGDHKLVTFTAAAAAGDPVGVARDVLTRAVRYAESRVGGDAIASRMLNGNALTTVKRRRPAKLVAALDHAIAQVTAHKENLAEHKQWVAELTAAREALGTLDTDVRKSRTERRQMTPEVKAARANWLKTYGSAKLLVESVLKQSDKLMMMPDIFDDLAETHRVPGVSDDGDTPAPTPGGAPSQPANP